MLDFRRCGACGTWFPDQADSCPSCGRFGLALHELFTGPRLAATGGLPLIAFALAFFTPGAWSAAMVSAGLSSFVGAFAWLLWRRRRRDPSAYGERIEDVQHRLEALDLDLEETDRRLDAARNDLERERSPRSIDRIEHELGQDRRLQSAQRRLVLQLERRLEQLRIERFRAQLRYFEACRDARIDSQAIAHELAARIREVPADRDPILWDPVLEDALLLQRQLARGVQRLHAARRLDPLAYADVTGELADAAPPAEDGELDEQTDQHLERIERSFEALEEIASELVGDPDASGVRLRVDDDLMAALDEAVEVEAASEDRVSVVGD